MAWQLIAARHHFTIRPIGLTLDSRFAGLKGALEVRKARNGEQIAIIHIMAFWYNVKTKQVETEENRSPASEILGPYSSYEAAAAALATAAEHRREQDAEEGSDCDPTGNK